MQENLTISSSVKQIAYGLEYTSYDFPSGSPRSLVRKNHVHFLPNHCVRSVSLDPFISVDYRSLTCAAFYVSHANPFDGWSRLLPPPPPPPPPPSCCRRPYLPLVAYSTTTTAAALQYHHKKQQQQQQFVMVAKTKNTHTTSLSHFSF